MIAVQTGNLMRLQQLERLSRTGSEIDLISKGYDAVGRVMRNVAQDGFKRGKIGVYIGNQGDTHGYTPS